MLQRLVSTIVSLQRFQSLKIQRYQIDLRKVSRCSRAVVCLNTICMEHLVDIKFGDLGENTGWLTFSLVNQLSIVSYIYKLGWK